jgi:hypothetical protein
VLSDVAIVALENVPAGQFSIDIVVGQKCPAAHGSQSADDVAPVFVWVVPVGQLVGVPDASGQ